MNSKLVYFTFIIMFSTVLVASIFPYPNFTSSNFLTIKEQKTINDYYEDEEIIEYGVPKTEVVNLDWFSAGDKMFVKYVTVRIIDIKSKKEFFVQRLGGYNHADIQTINKENTAIFKAIYGGEWSWARRPVWVDLGGKFIAASINGMPHGFSVFDNGQGGHTCVHFLNSKTHGTKKVDPDHQNAVAYAFEHRSELNTYLWQQSIVKK